MELGNLAFGHSQGGYPIDRGKGFESELFRLFEAYAPDRDNSWREYGVPFENGVFVVRQYNWDADCTCGFDDIDNQWLEENPHAANCYQNELRRRKLQAGFIENKVCGWLDWKNDNYEQGRDIERRIYQELCEERHLPYPFGCAIHCDCGRDERYRKWRETHDHADDCALVLPNFHHKPSGLKIEWYKYPLRDSYSNRPLTLCEFRAVIDDCIKSLEG